MVNKKSDRLSLSRDDGDSSSRSLRRDATAATLSDFVLSFPVIISRRFDSPTCVWDSNKRKGSVIFKYPSDPTVTLVYLSAAFLIACIVAGLFSSLSCSKSPASFVIIMGTQAFEAFRSFRIASRKFDITQAKLLR
ncbi:hypothetical protein HID58_037129 [Brassica napus]|uniref:Uncharacterized protein n=1 Tax=Brassica napus TaxID=3708 RepID=A0ABQ7XHF1_BRANA|nr:hypothetical protein HID58_037129 [Brassica napus]